MKHLFRLPLAVLLMAFAGACASPAQVDNMIVTAHSNLNKAKASPFYENIAVGIVTGGEETNPFLVSEVSNSGFRQALEASLANTFGTPSSEPEYTVSANLGGLDQPLVGFSFTVKSFAHYEVVDNTSKVAVFDEHITARHTAKVSDALIAAQRLRLANEGSIQANISAFLRRLLEIKIES